MTFCFGLIESVLNKFRTRAFAFPLGGADRPAAGGSEDGTMQTDFAALRQYLEGAWLHVHGDDELAHQLREALDHLIETVALAECSRPRTPAEILDFPRPRANRR
jgi:hypothetical protein